MNHAITLGELLAHPNSEVRRHAIGILKALERHTARVIREQDTRMGMPIIDQIPF